jgi:thioesterase domain-containing protein
MLRTRLALARYRRRGQPVPNALRYFYLLDASLKAGRAYRPDSYPGTLTLFRAEQPRLPDGWEPDDRLGWGPHARDGVEIVEIPGHHGAHIREPHVQVLARKLNEAIGRWLATAVGAG